MSKKIGIMSMQRIANYGSFLQAYALRQLILELGYNVEFVDYHVERPIMKVEKKENLQFLRTISKGIEILFYSAPLVQKIKFINNKKNFSKEYLPLLGINGKNYNPSLDCLVIGSDEVFNCIQKNTNVGYSLELFGKNNNAKKVITYAASFGNTTIEKIEKFNKRIELGGLLSKIDFISVRDKNSGEIVRTLTNKDVVYNLDPVLIYDYMNCCDYIPNIPVKEKFIILYAYPGRITEEESLWIKQYAVKKNLKVYSIGGIQSCADEFIFCSPFEVLSYFREAEEIITDTFHGSIFSIINHKKFTTLVRKSNGDSYGNEEKLSDLLNRLNLLDRMTFDIRETEKINSKQISYENVDAILKYQRKISRNYLSNSISD